MSIYFIYNSAVNEFSPSYLGDDHKQLDSTEIGRNTVLRAHSLKEKTGNQVSAKSIMKQNVRVLNLNNSLLDASQLFDKYNFHHLPIIEDTKLCGVLSSNDLRNIDNLEKRNIKDFYSKLIIAVSNNTPLSSLFKIFVKEEIHCLPVITRKGELEGIITQKDLLVWVLENKKYLK